VQGAWRVLVLGDEPRPKATWTVPSTPCIWYPSTLGTKHPKTQTHDRHQGGRAFRSLEESVDRVLTYFLAFSLRRATKPTRPVPRSVIVAGSGTTGAVFATIRMTAES
jgi:hypothetical protein